MISVLWLHIPLGGVHVVWCLIVPLEGHPVLPICSSPTFSSPQPFKTVIASSGVSRIWEVRQLSLCPQSWLGWAIFRPGSTSCARPKGSRVWWAGPGLSMGALGRLAQGPPSQSTLCLWGGAVTYNWVWKITTRMEKATPTATP